MENEKDKTVINLKEIEKWLENFFLDPLTTYLDETTFRIDLFETAEEYIIEALLSGYIKNEISVYLRDNIIQIEAIKVGQKQDSLQRLVPFPFPVIHHEAVATFEDGILEVHISKKTLNNGKNRSLIIEKN